VPDEPLARIEWTERAAAVASYREHFGHNSEIEAIGPAPRAADSDRRVAWEQAADALGIRGAERDMARHTEGELLNLIAAYTREEAWLPPNVDDRLRTAHIAARESEGSVARLRVQLEVEARHDAQRVDIAERLGRAEALAARMADRAATLDEIADVRVAAVASVADVEATARAARAELRHRGIDPETLRRDDAEREREAEPVTATAAEQHAEPERGPERGEHEEIDEALAAIRGGGSSREQRAERPAFQMEPTVREPAYQAARAGDDLDESARLREDLATARAAAERATAKRARPEREPEPASSAASLQAEPERAPERGEDEEIDPALAAIRGGAESREQRAERPAVERPAAVEAPGREDAEAGDDLDESARLREDLAKARAAAERLATQHEVKAEREADLDIDAALRAVRGEHVEQQRPPPQRDQGIGIGGP
jgi:hypothetical protein